MRRPLHAFAALVLAAGLALVQAQQPAPYVPRQSDRPAPVDGDEPGFKPIFDGRTLDGWDGDPKYWRVEDGALVGEITPATVVKSNTFVIWRGGRPRDFELKLDYRMHLLNGRLMSATIDDDAPNRPEDGVIGMQVHVGPPMTVQFRNIRLKTW